MPLRDTTQTILKLVEEHSGYRVHVDQDPDLSTFANVRMARRNVPAHFVRYKPAANDLPDYWIVYECGFILRLFANPPEQRFDLVSAPAGNQLVLKAVMAPDGPAQKLQLSPDRAPEYGDKLLDGLLVHLRSVPVGLRVAEWIHASFPEFHRTQRTAVLKELEQNREVLGTSMREAVPDLVLKPTLAINAAYALYWAEVYGDSDLATGYRHTRPEREGEQLLQLWRATPPDATHDRALIDAWAERLGLKGWYDWTLYQPPA